MTETPFMPKATAVWLVQNTTLSFKQIANFCNLHELEIKGIADGDVAKGIKAYNPILAGQLTREEIDTCSKDHEKSLKLFREIVNLGLTDVFRVFNSRDYEFTYWDYSRGSWEKDNGLRIDHFLATPLAIDRINDCQIEKKFRALERPSDHVPIWFEID